MLSTTTNTTITPANELKVKDWFEFILDLNLLEQHLKEDSSEPSGCSLIVQFLYHANLTEQIYNNSLAALPKPPQDPNQATNASTPTPTTTTTTTTTTASVPATNPLVEPKVKRIKLLRLLAIKTATLLDWDLLQFEKDIPVAVISDLLHIFLRLTLNDNDNVNLNQIDITKMDGHSLFAMQILSRWCLRTVIFSKYPKRLQNKSVVVQPTAPGIINTMPNFKEANESVLKALITTVKESVDFLENCLQNLNKDITIPVNDCFKLQPECSAETQQTASNEIEWNKAELYEQSKLKCLISYDLGMYYFQMENYERALKLFENSKSLLDQVNADINCHSTQMKIYLNDLDSYLVALNSMLNRNDEQSLDSIKSTQSKIVENLDRNFSLPSSLNAKKMAKKYIIVENELKNVKFHEIADESTFKELIDQLIEDNNHMILPIKFRLNLEIELSKLTSSKLNSTATVNAYNQVCFLNFMRLVLEENYFISQSSFEEYLKAFPQYSNIVEQISKQKHQRLILDFLKSREANLKESLNELNSPSAKRSPYGKRLNEYKYLALQICELNDLKKFINHHASLNSASEANLKIHWTKWSKNIIKLLQLSESSLNESSFTNLAFLKQFFQLDNLVDIDFYYICLAKLYELIEIKKLDRAMDIIKVFESYLTKSNQHILIKRLIWNQKLYINLLKAKKPLMSKSELVENCKNYLFNSKTDQEASKEILIEALSYLLSVGEYNFLINLTPPSHEKKSQSNIFNQGYYELYKSIAKVCVEMEKSDKASLRKISRELWDRIVEIFTESSTGRYQSDDSNANQPYDAAFSLFAKNKSQKSSKDQSSGSNVAALVNREIFKKIMASIFNKCSSSDQNPDYQRIVNLLVSLICTFYNITESSANFEISSEFRNLWPSSLANANNVDLNCLIDLMKNMLRQALLIINPYNTNWIRTQADIFMAQAQFSDSLKFYLRYALCATKYFFNDELDIYADEKFVKNMIKSASQLNKNTHVALISQLLNASFINSNSLMLQQQMQQQQSSALLQTPYQLNRSNFDYSIAFKCLQDKSNLTLDDADLLYDTIWDLTLLEYVTNLNAMNLFNTRKNICLKLFSMNNINASNPYEINQKTINTKRSKLFLKLINYYYF